jgi:hypothetical protein
MSDQIRKVVVNDDYGSFSLSLECAAACGLEITDTDREIGHVYNFDIARDCADLVNYVEHYGSAAAGGKGSKLAIVEIPADVKWFIYEQDGLEYVAEQHRIWCPKRD